MNSCSREEKPSTPADFERLEQDRLIQENLQRIGRKILVMSGKGGVGKSTVATYLALRLSARGHRVGLLDVDLHGPSIPHLVDVHGGFEMEGEGIIRPCAFSQNLKVASLEMMLGDRDAAVIWRGPLKISAIRQFISDITWGELDFLIADSPPGTGDEPLTVAQTIPEAEALVVTTPQEISLADVRKSINFCRQVGMKILGVVENMSGFSCPHCGKEINLFGKGGGERMSKAMGVPLLGQIPIEPKMVELADAGKLDALLAMDELEVNRAYDGLVDAVLKGNA